MSGATAVLIALLAQTVSSGPPAENADFPRYDGAAWELQRAGLTVKAAERSLRRAPDAVETVELLLAAQRTGDALQVLRRIVDRHPERMARAFEIVSRAPGASLHDDGLDHQAVLQPILEAAFGRLPALSREDAARAERMLMMVDRRKVPGRSFDQGLALFVERYRGTEAAAQTELEMLTRRRGQERLDALDAFIRVHPDALLGARALFEKGRYFSSNLGTSGIQPPNLDPTDRFLKTVEIVKELQSGRYPASEWVDRAPTLVTGFSWRDPALAEIVSSEVNVTLPDGEQATVPAVQPLPGPDNVLFLNGREAELLRSIAIAFRTSDPNPPKDPMYRLLAWWQTFFEAGPLAWGHLPVETHPVIRRLEFTSATRTQATARVSTGYSTGRAIVLRKVDGTWQVIRTGPEWVA